MSASFDFAQPWALLLLPLALLPLLRRHRDTLLFSYLAWLPVDRAGRLLGFLWRAFAVLTIGLTSTRTLVFCPIVAALGIVAAIGAVIMLPQKANLFGGMLVISPLNSLFKIICLVLALVTVPLASAEKSLRNPAEYIALLLLGAVGLMLLVGSEEFLMIFIGLELLALSLYVLAAFDKSDVRSAEAGLKYFLFGSTASVSVAKRLYARVRPVRSTLASNASSESCVPSAKAPGPSTVATPRSGVR